jgi:site-specific DNA-methyltransferase (adenine-specific)
MNNLGNILESLEPYHFSSDTYIYCANSINLMTKLTDKFPNGLFDTIFADPPYFLSNNGITCQNGKMVSVNKGEWDKSNGIEDNHKFNVLWLSLCQKLLKPNGTIWVSGTHHVIYSVGFAMQELGYKVLNNITWEKPNPPPNLSCRYFTHSTETLIWASKDIESKHVFNYDLMKEQANNRQMKSVWRIYPPNNEEKKYGKHPTQKPVFLIERCILASTCEGSLVFDPFMGTGATMVASVRNKRKFIGSDMDKQWLDISVHRLNDTIAEGLYAR